MVRILLPHQSGLTLGTGNLNGTTQKKYIQLRSLHPGTGNRWRTLEIPALAPGQRKVGWKMLETAPRRCR